MGKVLSVKERTLGKARSAPQLSEGKAENDRCNHKARNLERKNKAFDSINPVLDLSPSTFL